jgi:hypothetical protein
MIAGVRQKEREKPKHFFDVFNSKRPTIFQAKSLNL